MQTVQLDQVELDIILAWLPRSERETNHADTWACVERLRAKLDRSRACAQANMIRDQQIREYEHGIACRLTYTL